MKKLYYVFTQFWKQKIRQDRNLVYVHKVYGEARVSNCELEILDAIEAPRRNIRRAISRLKIKVIQNNRTRISREVSGKQVILPNPLFSQDQVSALRNKFYWKVSMLVLLLLGELGINLLLSKVIAPKVSETTAACIAAVITIGVMLFIEMVVTTHFIYIEAKKTNSTNKQNAVSLTVLHHRAIAGYVIGVLGFFSIIGFGLTRILYFSQVSTKGIAPELLHTKILQGELAATATFLFSICATLLSGFLKYDISSLAKSMGIYWNWSSLLSKRNGIAHSAEVSVGVIKTRISESIHKHSLLLVDQKLIFGLPYEFDEASLELHKKYLYLKSEPGFMVTEDIHREFMPIQMAHLELFEFGVLHNSALKPVFEEIAELENLIAAYTKEHTDVLIPKLGDSSEAPQAPNAAPVRKKLSLRGYASVGILLLLFAFLQACSPEPAPKAPPPPKNVIVFIDFSISDSSALHWYRDVIRDKVIPSLGQKDRLIIFPVDAGSQTASVEITVADFGANIYTNEMVGLDAAENAAMLHADSLLAVGKRFTQAFTVVEAHREVYVQSTDIFGAFGLAMRYIKPGYRNYILALTDGLQSTRECDMQHCFQTEGDISRYLDKADSVELRQVEVFFLTGAQPDISPKRFSAIGQFWKAYCHKYHGLYQGFTSGAVSSLQESLQTN